MPTIISKVASVCIKLIYPQACPCCENILLKEELTIGFCKECRGKIVLANKNTCMLCGRTIDDNSKEFCRSCENTHHYFKQGKVLYRYSGIIKDAIYRFKYANKRCYGRVFAREARREMGWWIEKIQPDLIVPIPMYMRKQRKRGYNQAEVFARELSKEFGIRTEANVVVRNKNTVPMKKLNKQQRVKNLRNAFTIAKDVVKFKKILIVDDIYTTGCTMDSVAKILLEAGAKEVYCLSVAAGEQ